MGERAQTMSHVRCTNWWARHARWENAKTTSRHVRSPSRMAPSNWGARYCVMRRSEPERNVGTRSITFRKVLGLGRAAAFSLHSGEIRECSSSLLAAVICSQPIVRQRKYLRCWSKCYDESGTMMSAAEEGLCFLIGCTVLKSKHLARM